MWESWVMGYNCNFNCKYCGYRPETGLINKVLPIRRIIKALKETDKEWVIG